MLTLEIVRKTSDADKAHSEAARDLWITRKKLNSFPNLSEIEKKLILEMKREKLSKATIARDKAHAEYDRAKAQGISSEVELAMGNVTDSTFEDANKVAKRIKLLSENSPLGELARSLVFNKAELTAQTPSYDKSNDPDYEYDPEQDLYVKKKKENSQNE